MMTLERTVDVGESREVRFTLPETVPAGRVNVTVTYTAGSPEQAGLAQVFAPAPASEEPDEEARRKRREAVLNWKPPTIAELKEEARRKAEVRRASGVDVFAELRGSLKGVFGDGVKYQRELRDEWPD